jgi:hypothetical protein
MAELAIRLSTSPAIGIAFGQASTNLKPYLRPTGYGQARVSGPVANDGA